MPLDEWSSPFTANGFEICSDHAGEDHMGVEHLGVDHLGVDHLRVDHLRVDHLRVDHLGVDHAGRSTCSSCQRADDLFHVADLADAQAKILADLHRFAKSDRLVVDHQFERFIAALGKFDDRAGTEAEHF